MNRIGKPNTRHVAKEPTQDRIPALDVVSGAVPEYVEPEASTASRTISITIVPCRATGGAS